MVALIFLRMILTHLMSLRRLALISQSMHISRILISCVLIVTLTACQNMKKKGGASYAGADGDYVSGTPLPERREGVSFLSDNVSKGQFPPVYFPFDSYEISEAERSKVARAAETLRGGSGNVIVAGFTDERGTPEYNRGLGERRAQAVRQELLKRGVSGGKIQTVSFGEEMPADPGSSESAWAKNRRAEFGISR
jgi:peptidoglycan-associated lipoprotein